VRTGEDPGGQGVPQDVNACAVPTQPLIGGVNGFLDHAPTDRLAQRGDMSNENLATCGLRPLVKKIVGDGLTCRPRERQHVSSAAFAQGDPDGACLPVDVV
jgi:hypothetical protein